MAVDVDILRMAGFFSWFLATVSGGIPSESMIESVIHLRI